MKTTPVQKQMCATCPFREGVPEKYSRVAGEIAISALTEASRICHSTGSNAFNRHTGKKEKLCRGARDLQLRLFFEIGFLDEPTDRAWAAKVREVMEEP